MKELDELIYARISTDPWIKYWLTLAGEQAGATKPTQANPDPPGNAYGLKKTKHAKQKEKPEVPQLNFYMTQLIPGALTGNHTRTLEAIYEFGAFAKTYFELTNRLRVLLDGWCFDVPTGYESVGKAQSVFDWEGGEGFDEELKENFRYIRFRFFVATKAQIPT